ncbi:MAG: T9SS type A sorting domain-containing protein [Bacteroidia bacterium]
MLSKKYFVLFFFAFIFGKSFSQDTCITAGDTLIHYTDINPHALVYGCCYNPPDSFALDLDHDGTIDFYLVDWFRTDMMGGYGWGYIQGTGQNKVLVDPANYGTPFRLNLNDSICSGGSWAGSGHFINYNIIFGDSVDSYSHSPWADIGPYYVGLQIAEPVDSVYGWIQISAHTGGSAYAQLEITSYGCGYKTPTPTHIDPPVIADGLIFYPNPTTDIVNIFLPKYSSYQVKILDDLGQVVYDQYGSIKMVDMRALRPGIYYLTVKTSEETFQSKVIRVKENK